MRDLLTVLAGLVVLVLAAALAVPPLVSWEGQRPAVDRALARATGLDAQTEGRIGLRLLPSPRLSLDGLRLGAGAQGASLDARGLEAEVALAPLLQGVIHFTEARADRAEVKLPVAPGGGFALPPGAAGLLPSALAVEDLRIGELLLTRVAPATGRTDQVVAQDVHVTASALSGPWQVEGTYAGAGFRLVTGSLDDAGTLPLKLEAGGDTAPRVEVDARLSLPEGGGMPSAAGSFRLVVGPPTQAAGPYVPFVLAGKLATQGTSARLDDLVLDLDPGGAALRLNGRGGVDLAAPAASLVLDARRLDLDAFLLSPVGRALLERRGTGLAPALPLDLTLGIESANLVGEGWSSLGLDARLAPDGTVALRRLAATAPGEARLEANGEARTGSAPSFAGRVALVAPQPGRIARMLERVGVPGPFPLLDAGRPLDLAGDVTLAPPVAALRNARLALGEAKVTGSARYTGPEPGGARGRFDAQVSAQGLDVADLSPLRDLNLGLAGLDFALAVTATDLRYGTAARGGRLTADIRSDGPALRIDGLEVTNLAGADARASGRIAPDGTGRIAGRVTAARAAPLLDLAAAAWPGLPRRMPAALRGGALDLAFGAERAEGGRLALDADGRAAGATLRARLDLAGGSPERLTLEARAPDAATWLGRPGDAGLARPGTLSLSGERRDGGLALTGQGTLAPGTAAEIRLATGAPLLLDPEGGPPLSGTLTLAGADAAPLAGLLGAGVRLPAPLPVDLRLALSRDRSAPRLALAGRAGEATLDADLTLGGAGLAGSLVLDRLALPRLFDALVLDPEPEARASTGAWPTARFRTARPALTGRLALRVAALDLGRGLLARDAAFTLASDADTLALTEGRASLGEGRLSGGLALTRGEGQAGLSGEARVEGIALAALAGAAPRGAVGRLSGSLRFGASGTSAAALVANLAGEGQVSLADLALPGGDPEALGRTAARLLREDDPLRAGRAQDVAADEFARAPLRAASAAAPAILVGGALRLAPLALDLGAAAWQGSAAYDLRTLRLDARGTLALRQAPRGWTGPPPTIGLGWTGPLADPARGLDPAPLVTGLAAVVLKRELDTIELYEEDQSERQRRQRQLDMDRARAADARRAAEAARAAQGAAGPDASVAPPP